MNKSFLASIFFITIVGIVIGCSYANKGESKIKEAPKSLIGKWQNANVETMILVLDLKADSTWKYFKNDTLLVKGKFEIVNGNFILKNEAEEHDHVDGDHHHDEVPQVHVYTYSINNDGTELSLTIENRKSVYKKIQE